MNTNDVGIPFTFPELALAGANFHFSCVIPQQLIHELV